jgi:hypothetical protein
MQQGKPALSSGSSDIVSSGTVPPASLVSRLYGTAHTRLSAASPLPPPVAPGGAGGIPASTTTAAHLEPGLAPVVKPRKAFGQTGAITTSSSLALSKSAALLSLRATTGAPSPSDHPLAHSVSQQMLAKAQVRDKPSMCMRICVGAVDARPCGGAAARCLRVRVAAHRRSVALPAGERATEPATAATHWNGPHTRWAGSHVARWIRDGADDALPHFMYAACIRSSVATARLPPLPAFLVSPLLRLVA